MSIFLGGTGSANELEDYEEGTCTPYFLCTNNSQTVAYHSNYQHGHYTKIGNKVFATCRMYWTSKSGTGSFDIWNLPFTSASDNNKSQPCGMTLHYRAGMWSDTITGYLLNNNNKVRIGRITSGSFSDIPFENVNGSGEFNAEITYYV